MDEIFEQIIEQLKLFPGVGSKSAERYAMKLLSLSSERRAEFIEAITKLDDIQVCSRCNNYSLDDLCQICQENRPNTSLVIVANANDIKLIERVYPQKFNYHVLAGVIDPLKGVLAKNLNFNNLLPRVANYDDLILVLPTTTEGELTASYIRQIVDPQIEIYKIAQGIPSGGTIDYLDELTLTRSIASRQKI